MKRGMVASVGIAAGIIVFGVGCTLPGVSQNSPSRPETKITPDDPANPKRIRFDVYGDPFTPAPSGSAEANLPVHVQIRMGMRRYAESKLKELSWCPNGFTGPDAVLAPERNRLMSFFYVECLSSSPR